MIHTILRLVCQVYLFAATVLLGMCLPVAAVLLAMTIFQTDDLTTVLASIAGAGALAVGALLYLGYWK